ncbi:Myelin P2 protein [Aquarana catesbeiana]|uniref:Myelin P2 protein n=1 Tax=Aquarana catesbeiana TaxID=8400 RepID=A0A2G9S0Z0_AQUCT|nr:Myelin P2 protein [Aquarana catesbeiana]
MCEEMLGCWKLISSEGFDVYMKALGVDMGTRILVSPLKPDVIISKNGDDWCIKTVSSLKTTDLCFILNKEFDEDTADKRKCKTIFKLNDGKLIQTQKWDGKESIITRQVQNGQLITDCICDDAKCHRVYEKK